MKLKDLITDSNVELYKRVSHHLPIQLKRSDDELWRSSMDEKRIIITYSDTVRPQACFTHELLHIDMQQNEYRRLRSGLSLNHAAHQQLPFLCPVIDNEFQHHKMYSRFINSGYSPDEFYHEADVVSEQYIENGIRAKGQSLPSHQYIWHSLHLGDSFHRINSKNLRQHSEHMMKVHSLSALIRSIGLCMNGKKMHRIMQNRM